MNKVLPFVSRFQGFEQAAAAPKPETDESGGVNFKTAMLAWALIERGVAEDEAVNFFRWYYRRMKGTDKRAEKKEEGGPQLAVVVQLAARRGGAK